MPSIPSNRYPKLTDFIQPVDDTPAYDPHKPTAWKLDDKVAISRTVLARLGTKVREALKGDAIVIDLPGFSPESPTAYHIEFANGLRRRVQPGALYLVQRAGNVRLNR